MSTEMEFAIVEYDGDRTHANLIAFNLAGTGLPVILSPTSRSRAYNNHSFGE